MLRLPIFKRPLLRFFSSRKFQTLTGILAHEHFKCPHEKQHVEKLLLNLSEHETQKGEIPHESCWHYGKAEEEWDDMCQPGNYQSPINIESQVVLKSSEILKESFHPIRTDYKPLVVRGKFTTKTFLVQGEFGSMTINSLTEDKRVFDVLQFHFHSPAEHLINSQRHDLELHIVHQERGKAHNMSVIGFLFKVDGVRNPFLDEVIQSHEYLRLIDLQVLFPKDKMEMYLYEGSLTTPPLLQGVLWFLMSKLHSMSIEQLDFFRQFWNKNKNFADGKGNNREIQPLHDRKVIHFH